jgi:hypothetical protein
MSIDLHHVGTCATCGKRCYPSKAHAKKVARSLRGDRSGQHLSAYRCGDTAYWHLGHLLRAVVRGVMGRDEIRRASGGKSA